MTNWILLLVVSGLMGATTWAGDFKGNGGSSVACPGQALQILDFFEMKVPLQLGPPDLNFSAKAQIYLKRVATFSAARAALYLVGFQKFEEEAVFLNGIPIDTIPDTDFVPPPGCDLVQVINQNPALLPPGKHYLVDLNQWQKLSAEQQLGLIFHELLYRESTAKTSKAVRELNALIASGEILRRSAPQIVGLLKAAELPWAELQGMIFDLNKPFAFDARGVLRSAVPMMHSVFKKTEGTLDLRADAVEFYENGAPQKLRFFGGFKYQVAGQPVQFENNEYDHVYLQFYPDGKVKEGPLTWYQNWQIKTAHLEIIYHYVRLSPQGEIQLLADASGYVGLEGQRVHIVDKTELQFFANLKLAQFIWGGSDSLTIWGQKIFPQYGSPVRLLENSSLSSFVSSKEGRLQLPDGSWKSFKKGDLVELAGRSR